MVPLRDEAIRVFVRTLSSSVCWGLGDRRAGAAAAPRRVRRAGAARERGALRARDGRGQRRPFRPGPSPGGPSFFSDKCARWRVSRASSRPDPNLARMNVHPYDRPELDAAFDAHVEGRRRATRSSIEPAAQTVRGIGCTCAAAACATRKVSRLASSVRSSTSRSASVPRARRSASTQLRKSQKMEAMGTLAGGIAHDFNNILGAIVGYGELAQKSAAPGSVVRRYVDNVMHAAGRAKALVERILAFSRSGIGERVAGQRAGGGRRNARPARRIAAAGHAARAQARSGRRGGDRRRDAAPSGGDESVHERRAGDAGGRRARSSPRARRRAASAAPSSHGELVPGPYVRLTRARHGHRHRAPDVLDRIFDPFFTTKGVGEGTGRASACRWSTASWPTSAVRSTSSTCRTRDDVHDLAAGRGLGARPPLRRRPSCRAATAKSS